MSTPTDPYPNFLPGALADADQVDARFKALYDYVQAGVDLLSGNPIVAKANLKTDALQHFLQLLSDGDHKIAFGTVAAGNLNNVASRSRRDVPGIAHGLSGTPKVAVFPTNRVAITEDGGTTSHTVMASADSITGTDFTACFEVNGTSAVSIAGWWLAIS